MLITEVMPTGTVTAGFFFGSGSSACVQLSLIVVLVCLLAFCDFSWSSSAW